MRFIRLVIVILAIAGCLWTIGNTASFAFSRMLVKYALVTRDTSAAREASSITPKDAHALNAVATLESLSGNPRETVAALERAAALRRDDYSLWQALGLQREEVGDKSGALQAFDEALRLAPFYAPPRWQRGNLLLRMGRTDDGFKDLNQAAASSPELSPRLLDLAWTMSRDPSRVQQLVPLQSAALRLAFARLLARENRFQEAVQQVQLAGDAGREVSDDIVQQFLSQGAHTEAFHVWKAHSGHNHSINTIYDGGFETPIAVDEKAFGWRVATDLKNLAVKRDATDRQSGVNSLLIEFAGASTTPNPIMSQLVIVESSARYRLSFAARAKNIVSGGPPLITVTDAQNQKLLDQSELLVNTPDWRTVAIEFTTSPETKALMVNVTRGCEHGPCPIFGSLSLDSFALERVK